jgi:hypothetical protein
MLTPTNRILPDVWDDAMFNPATGCLKTVSAYQGKSPQIPHPGLTLQCLALRDANRACRLYSSDTGGNGIA